MNAQLNGWFSNISIKIKLYFVVGVMALLIAVELLTLWFAVKTLSSVRAYVGGEGLWSKSQKDAGYYLQKYGHTHDEKDYARFIEFLKIPIGDGIARKELLKPKPDLNIVKQGFLIGNNHRDDIDGMIWLMRNFSSVSYIHKVIDIWGKAEPLVIELIPIGKKLHAEINSQEPSSQQINNILAEIDPINQQLTILENDFSYTLGEGSRWLENLILKILFLIAITVEFTGLFLTLSVSITISKGIKEVIRVSNEVAKGNIEAQAIVFSRNEIGLLAESFNKMVSDLRQKMTEMTFAEERERAQKKTLEEYAVKLEQSNKELEQFAYVTSHDLKEPLRTISSYVQLLENRYKDKLDNDANEFISFVVEGVNRMDDLISDLLTYSRIGRQEATIENVDCSVIVKMAMASLEDSIRKNNATIIVENLPVIRANKQQINQVFQNLINNAIKFHSDLSPEIKISAAENEFHWLFSVKDNGIGIDPKYAERIFVIFQRLNSREDYEGTGIGLTICKKIIEQYGGHIWVESEINKGSTFYFTIPK